MKRSAARGVAVACLLAACTTTALGATGQGVELSDAAQALVHKFPGVQVMTEMGRVVGFYGKPMTSGATTDAAVNKFLDEYGHAFGVGDLDLRVTRIHDVSFGKFDVFAYEQFVDGLPVEYGAARILVLKGQDTNRVVYAAGKLASKPSTGFAPITVTDGAQALAIIQSSDQFKGLPAITQPEMVVYFGEGDLPQWTEAVRAWKVTVGISSHVIRPVKFTVFVDAATGQIIHARDIIVHADVAANVQAKLTPGTKPDTPANPAVLGTLPDIKVNITGGSNGYTDASGNVTLSNPGTSAVTVTTKVGDISGDGRWVRIDDVSSAVPMSLSQSVTPPGPVNFVFNNTPTAANTGQANVFKATNVTHNFIKDRAPAFTELDTSIWAKTSLSSTCNAHFDPTELSINFYSAGGGCVNSGYANVVHHEYGHFIVNRLGLAQGGFGEGYGDCCSLLIQDTTIIGEDFQGTGAHIRTPVATITPTGCTAEGHTCGQTLGGVWYVTRQNLGSKYGSSLGLDVVRQLFVDWSMITLGGSGSDSAVARTAIEVLTVNDTDGDIGNGTPDYQQICAAFSTRSISCPVIQLIDFAYPDGLPTSMEPDAAKTFRVNVTPITLAPVAGSGKLTYRIEGGSFTTVNMTETAPNEYTATLPAVGCLSKVDFYVSATATGGTVVTDPESAPTSVFISRADSGITTTTATVFTDDMQTNKGWTTGPETATSGRWERVDPTATSAQPGDDHTSGAGTICWITDGDAGSSVGDFDVDGGQTVLNSPTLDLAAYEDAQVNYWRWYSNDQGANPGTKTFKVEVSNNGGSSWVRAQTFGPTGPDTVGGWRAGSFKIRDFVIPTASTKIRFIADDLGTGSGSIVEAAIDDVQIVGIACDEEDCAADLNGDGLVDFTDYLEFLSLYDVGDLAVDFNGDGLVDFTDYLEFLSLYDAGC